MRLILVALLLALPLPQDTVGQNTPKMGLRY